MSNQDLQILPPLHTKACSLFLSGYSIRVRPSSMRHDVPCAKQNSYKLILRFKAQATWSIIHLSVKFQHWKPWQVPLPHANPLWHAPAASQGLSTTWWWSLSQRLVGAQHLFLRKTSAQWLFLAYFRHSLNMHKTQLCIHNLGVPLLPGQARWTNAALDARNAQGRLNRWTLSSVWNSGRRPEPVALDFKFVTFLGLLKLSADFSRGLFPLAQANRFTTFWAPPGSTLPNLLFRQWPWSMQFGRHVFSGHGRYGWAVATEHLPTWMFWCVLKILSAQNCWFLAFASARI